MAATIIYVPAHGASQQITIAPETPVKEELRAQVARDTLGGRRRLGLLWRKFKYTLLLEPLATTDYQALLNLWVSARAAGAWPTFSWPEWWPDETTIPVAVEMELGPMQNVYGPYVKATLVLTEVNPR